MNRCGINIKMAVFLVFEVSLASNSNVCVTLLIIIAPGKRIIFALCQCFSLPGDSWLGSQRRSLINIRGLVKSNFCISDWSIVNEKIGGQGAFVKTKTFNCVAGSSGIHIVFKRNRVVLSLCQRLTVESNCYSRCCCASRVVIGTRGNIVICIIQIKICIQLCRQGLGWCRLHRCCNRSSSCIFQLNYAVLVYRSNCGISGWPVKGCWIQNGFHIRKSCACHIDFHRFLCFGKAYRGSFTETDIYQIRKCGNGGGNLLISRLWTGLRSMRRKALYPVKCPILVKASDSCRYISRSHNIGTMARGIHPGVHNIFRRYLINCQVFTGVISEIWKSSHTTGAVWTGMGRVKSQFLGSCHGAFQKIFVHSYGLQVWFRTFLVH